RGRGPEAPGRRARDAGRAARRRRAAGRAPRARARGRGAGECGAAARPERHAELPRPLASRGAPPRADERLGRRSDGHGLRRAAGAAARHAARGRPPPGAPPGARRRDGRALTVRRTVPRDAAEFADRGAAPRGVSYDGGMRLSTLLDGLGPRVARRGPDVEIRALTADSRTVERGDVFFALAGARDDGRAHVAEAVARGAAAVVSESPVDAPGVTIVTTDQARRLLGL